MVGRALSAVNAVSARLGRRAVIWAAVLTVLALVLDFVPLFNLLGFDFSFAIGLAAAWAGVDVGHGVAARARNLEHDARSILRLALQAVATALATLVAPLLLSLANMVRVPNCSVGAGLAFYALLPVATVIYAAPAGVLCALAFPRRGRVLALALPALSMAWALARMYRDPAVFVFDPFGGYFPGPIYDEALRPPLRLLEFRLTNLVWIATAMALGAAALRRGLDPRRWRRRALWAAIPLLAGSCVLFAMRGPLGFHVRHSDLRSVLDAELRTSHFILRYASAAGKTKADLALGAEDLEFRYQQLREILAIEPLGVITVYEFPSAETKKALVGAGYTLYAKPWTREIFLQADRFPSNRLRHEMAHVFAGAFGDRLFGIALGWRWKGPLPLPTLASGLIEGVAEAADSGDPDGATTVHQDAQAIVADGRAPPLETIVGAGFTTVSGPRAYTLAGSFCAFLLETRGADKLRRLYRSGGNFIDVYRTPLANLEQEWRQFLARQPLSEQDRSRASEQFRRPAIFKKVCARELAARVGDARARLRSAPEQAVKILEETCADDPHEPTFRIELAEAWAAMGQRGRALEILGKLAIQGDVTGPLRARIASVAAEIHFHSGDDANVTAEEQKVMALATEDGDRRLAHTRMTSVRSQAARDTLGRAIFGAGFREPVDAVLTFYLLTEYARLHPGDRLGPYLVGRQLLGRDPAHALPYLRRACEEDDDAPALHNAPPLPPDFLRECRRMIVEAGYRVGDFPRARAALRRLVAKADTEAERLRSLDMEQRIAWLERTRTRVGPAGAP
jgi:tetratricopeptide (TPR) repeat protein